MTIPAPIKKRYPKRRQVNIGPNVRPKIVTVHYRIVKPGVIKSDAKIIREAPHCIIYAGEGSGLSNPDRRHFTKTPDRLIVRKDIKGKISKALREAHPEHLTRFITD